MFLLHLIPQIWPVASRVTSLSLWFCLADCKVLTFLLMVNGCIATTSMCSFWSVKPMFHNPLPIFNGGVQKFFILFFRMFERKLRGSNSILFLLISQHFWHPTSTQSFWCSKYSITVLYRTVPEITGSNSWSSSIVKYWSLQMLSLSFCNTSSLTTKAQPLLFASWTSILPSLNLQTYLLTFAFCVVINLHYELPTSLKRNHICPIAFCGKKSYHTAQLTHHRILNCRLHVTWSLIDN